MIYGVYSIFDSKAVTFSQPFYSVNNGTAVRQFTETINSQPALVSHAADYNLCQVGQFDDASGELHANEQPITPLCNGASVVNHKETDA